MSSGSHACVPHPVSSTATTGRRPLVGHTGPPLGRGSDVLHRLTTAAPRIGVAVGARRIRLPVGIGLAVRVGLPVGVRLAVRVGLPVRVDAQDVVEADAGHEGAGPGACPLQQAPRVDRRHRLVVPVGARLGEDVHAIQGRDAEPLATASRPVRRHVDLDRRPVEIVELHAPAEVLRGGTQHVQHVAEPVADVHEEVVERVVGGVGAHPLDRLAVRVERGTSIARGVVARPPVRVAPTVGRGNVGHRCLLRSGRGGSGQVRSRN